MSDVKLGEAYVEVKARLDGLLKDLDKAKGATTKATGFMGHSFGKLKLGVSSLTAAVSAFTASLTPGALFLMVKGALNAAEAIDDMSKRIGISAEKLQELRFAFTQNGAALNEVDAALVKANLSIAQFIATGAGPAAVALKELGLATRQSVADIGGGDAQLDAVIRRLARVKDASKQSAIAFALFGETGGPALSILLQQGEGAIDGQIKKARELGLVLKNDAVGSAAAASAQLRAMSGVIKTQLTTSLVTLAPEIIAVTDAFARNLPVILDWISKVSQAVGLIAKPITTQIDAAEKRIIEFQRILRTGGFMEGGSVDAGPIQEQIAKERALIEALKSQQSEIATRLADVGGGASIPVVPRPLPPVIPGAGGGGGPAADGFSDAQRAAEERIAALYRERDALGLSADAAARLTTEYEANKLKAELLKEARENGNGVSAFEAQLVTETVDAYREASFALLDATAAHEALAKSQEEAAQASERAREDMKQFTSSMFGAIDASKSLKENLANVGVQLLNLAAQGAGGSGPLAGIFSAIGQGISGFGFSGAGTHGPVTNAPLLAPTFRLPGLASGTNFAQGGATIVGEQGPEIVNMPRGAQVFNAGESAQMLGGRSTNVFNIDARGSNDPAAVEAAAQRGAAMALAQVPGINRDMKRRGAL